MFPFTVILGTLFAIWVVASETKLNITWWKRRGHLLEMTYAAWNYRKKSSGFYMNSFSRITVCVTKNQINECKRLISSRFALRKIEFELWLKSLIYLQSDNDISNIKQQIFSLSIQSISDFKFICFEKYLKNDISYPLRSSFAFILSYPSKKLLQNAQ